MSLLALPAPKSAAGDAGPGMFSGEVKGFRGGPAPLTLVSLGGML